MPHKDTPHLTIVKGGKVSPREFIALPFEQKLHVLVERPAREQRDLIVDDPDGQLLTRALPPFSLYLTIKEIGEMDSLDLIHFASPEQLTFFFDLELWKGWTFSADKAFEWIERLLEGGERLVAEFVRQTDPELLLIIFMKEIAVGGGTGVLTSDDERLDTWDHSFDQIYFITFLNTFHSRTIGSFLDIIHRRDHSLYMTLMERIKCETVTEMEDMAFQERSGRLADLGFPEVDDALSIYVFVNPETFRLQGEKAGQALVASVERLPLPLLQGDTLLQRLLARQESPELLVELNYLINNALVADDPDFSDSQEIETIMQRVYGYLNIALEFLSGTDEEKAARILREEFLKDLFRLGFSLLLQLRRRGGRVATSDYAVGKVLAGLKAKRPRFYRGLDPDGIDGYREFREYADVEKTSALLEELGEA